MSRKKRSNHTTARGHPNSAVSFLLSNDAYDMLCVSGYTRLADNPEIQMAAGRIADLMGSMTIHLMQNTEDGDVRIKNGLSRKLDINPSGNLTRSAFISTVVRTLLIDGDGNCVVYPKFSRSGDLIEDLEILPPSIISFVPDGRSYYIRYGDQTFRPDEVLHFAINQDPETPWLGHGYRVTLKDVAHNLKQAAATKRGFMESKWKPSIVVKVDGLTDEFSSKEGRKKLLDSYLETSEAGEPWMIPAEMFDVKEIKPLTLNDLAINDSVTIDKRTVAGIIGVPPFVVGVGSYNRDEWNNFVDSKLMPLSKRIEQELTLKLLYSPDLYFRFNSRTLHAYDMKDMASIGQELYVRGIMTGNEVRDWLGMTPLTGLDELVILENYIPRGMIADQAKLNGGENSE